MGSITNEGQVIDGRDTLAKLRSGKCSQRLEQIANLRARGVAEHVDLPQIVVCGDQSCGKSSVLEGVTGLPFPRQDGVCTKFPTEIILTHTDGPSTIVARIIPCSSRSETSKEALTAWSRVMTHFEELPNVTAEASTLLGIRGSPGIDTGPSFVEDVLRIQVSGPTGLHLTVVDLPGLIAVASEEQTDEDVATVQQLVDSYVKSPRTIILAVVQAGNDIANQGIIQKSKKFDKQGQRTVGIITKPDLINRGTEARIAALSKNLDTTKLKLGFFLLKNPSPTDIATGFTPEERERSEKAFFKASPWKEQSLDTSRVGVVALRNFLQQLLDQHIERELPKVREEIKQLIKQTEADIIGLGEERPTPGHHRMYLSRVAMRFHNLTTAGLHADYHGTTSTFFEDVDAAKGYLRLRSFVHNVNTAFSDDMRLYGQTMKIVERPEPDEDDFTSEDDEQSPLKLRTHAQTGQCMVTRQEMRNFVLKLYRRTRGRELPGNYNYVLLTELFQHQSRGWKTIASDHIDNVYQNLLDFLHAAVRYTSADEQVSLEMLDKIETALLQSKQAADAELERLWDDKDQQPITYNHYYTENIRNARQDDIKKWIKGAVSQASETQFNGKIHVSNTVTDIAKLLQSLQSQVLVDMDEVACTEAITGFEAYYKVARKTFVDNVCIQVIERHLLRGLPNMFSPESVALYTDEELQRIAGEVEGTVIRRKQLQAMHESLVAGLKDLRW